MRKRFYGCENGLPIDAVDQYFSVLFNKQKLLLHKRKPRRS
jgi:hypothetical protein